MKRKIRLYDKLSFISVLANGTVPGVPLIEIISDKRVLFENHHGICKYTHEQICVKSDLGIIKISGENLHIKTMSAAQLMILGKINCISICRGNNNEDS